MALQLKYECRQFHIDAQGAQVVIEANVLVTTYDDAGNIVKQQSGDTPKYLWSELPATIQNDILTLRDHVIAALKTKYGTTAVTMIAPGG
jgi:hypothetical protein